MKTDVVEPDYRKSKIVTVRLTPDEVGVLMANRKGLPGRQTITSLVRTAIQEAYMKATLSESDPIPAPEIRTESRKRAHEPAALNAPIRDVLSFRSGDCLFQYPRQMSQQEVVDLLEWLTLLQRKVRRLGDELAIEEQ